MKAVIHCGSFKTGSTAIQNTAYHNRDRLAAEGVLYPTTGLDRRAAHENGAIGFRHSRFIYEYGTPEHKGLFDQLGREIHKNNPETLILSAEPWSWLNAAPSLNEIVTFLYQFGFTDVRGSIFLRNVGDYMVRHYREFTRRHGNALRFDRYVRKHRHFFDYLTICRNLTKAFQGRIDFINYDSSENVVDTFFNRSRINPRTLKKPENLNEGIGSLDAEMTRILNQYRLRINDLPPSGEILASFGLAVTESGVAERLGDNLLAAFDAKYQNAFAETTGWSATECKAVFQNQTPSDSHDVGRISPIVERVLFEYLRRGTVG